MVMRSFTTGTATQMPICMKRIGSAGGVRTLDP
jgi:hypothetical protein